MLQDVTKTRGKGVGDYVFGAEGNRELEFMIFIPNFCAAVS